MAERSIITIGVFDGVHLGHRALVRRADAWRRAHAPEARILALAFDPHPLTRLRPQAVPARLSTFAQRVRWLQEAGADEVERLDPGPDLLGLEAEAFVERFLLARGVACVVEGADFRFGKGRRADCAALAEIGARRGFAVEVVDPVQVALTDATTAAASSSLVRRLLAAGRVGDASVALGRPYEMEGPVQRGDRRGRLLGIPTLNLGVSTAAPRAGVYAGEVALPDGRLAPAAISVGVRPMYPDSPATVEAHLIGMGPEGPAKPNLPGLPEYGWAAQLRFCAWLRDQIAYPSAEALVAQIERDCARALLALQALAEPAHV
ncbi:MAG: riboflavin kinase [Phycisphaerales bacterium JB039]